MTTHFERLRKLTICARIITPSLVFVAFLLYIKLGAWPSMLTNMVGLIILMIFPTERTNTEAMDLKSRSFVYWLQTAAAFSFTSWIIEMLRFSSLFDQILLRDSLWHWRLVLAVFIWCLTWSCNMVRKAIALTDRDIVTIYSSSSSEGNPESKQDATSSGG
jgi:hypothetical protein